MFEKEIFFRIFNVKIKVSTNYPRYYDYLRLHFNKVILPTQTDNCEIEVKAEWKKNFFSEEQTQTAIDSAMVNIGANTMIGPGRILTIRKIGRKKKVRLNFSLKKGKLLLAAVLQRKPFKDKIRYDIFGQPQESYFFELTYALIYYPLFWYLEYFQDTHVLHASAVRIADKCIVICGLEGMGKTTLSLSLASEPGGRLFSDNLIFYDKDNIFPCYEPIRIHKSDDKSLWEGRFRKINQFKTLKDFYEPISSDLASKDKPYAFIIPLFSQDFFVKEIPKDKFINKILNLNHLTAELGNYNEYATLLNLLDSDFKIWQLREAALHNILEPAHCYEIGMRKSDGVEKNLQRLKDSILK